MFIWAITFTPIIKIMFIRLKNLWTTKVTWVIRVIRVINGLLGLLGANFISIIWVSRINMIIRFMNIRYIIVTVTQVVNIEEEERASTKIKYMLTK